MSGDKDGTSMPISSTEGPLKRSKRMNVEVDNWALEYNTLILFS